jgi:predicted RNA binding protein YcfA (HicA-like mRNA interferase family)
MKRIEILKKLAEAGFTFVEGGNHTKAYDATGRFRTTIGRHTEINDFTTRKIEKQTGVKLL